MSCPVRLAKVTQTLVFGCEIGLNPSLILQSHNTNITADVPFDSMSFVETVYFSVGLTLSDGDVFSVFSAALDKGQAAGLTHLAGIH